MLGKGWSRRFLKTIASVYDKKPDAIVRDVVGAALKRLFPEPLAVVTGSRNIDLSLMRTQEGKLAVHLVNTSGPIGRVV